MNILKTHSMILSIFFSVLIMFTSCASTTWIKSEPPNAKLYINDEHVGWTPYSYSDTRIWGTTNSVRIEKEGYKTFNTTFTRNEEVDILPVIGGFFLLAPLLWTMKYKNSHNYELSPLVDNQNVGNSPNKKDKVQQLLELKKLLDSGILTKEEFDKEKKKILGD